MNGFLFKFVKKGPFTVQIGSFNQESWKFLTCEREYPPKRSNIVQLSLFLQQKSVSHVSLPKGYTFQYTRNKKDRDKRFFFKFLLIKFLNWYPYRRTHKRFFMKFFHISVLALHSDASNVKTTKKKKKKMQKYIHSYETPSNTISNNQLFNSNFVVEHENNNN